MTENIKKKTKANAEKPISLKPLKKQIIMIIKLTYINLGFIAWVKRKQKVRIKDNPSKINLGSGLSVAQGWINIDHDFNTFCHNWPSFLLKCIYLVSGISRLYSYEDYVDILRHHCFVFHNLQYGIPFYDKSIDYIYSSHFLEHLYRDQGKYFTREAYRVLKKGGKIRICVPDLNYACSLYQKGQTEKALRFFFPDTKSEDKGYHRYMYDFNMLHTLLQGAGFSNIEKCSYRQGNTPDINTLDVKPEETLFLEAIK